ncbi:hypothetical protein XELAEV_18043504mg [Xenopus laevis]|uniref:KIND domain-containing protein n=1 Tax=Xenopus laevis TaxID=8355 RepID=A0A974BX50_XENLA|nr:hypothetical protein XELAEV_18043504mg [Xenopus laevis]
METVGQDGDSRLIEHIAQVIYTALDWGLTSNMERVLSEPLDKLLYVILGLHGISMDYNLYFQCPVTLKDIIKQCAERLFTPSEASCHYRAVCRVLFAEHEEFCNLLLTIERSKQQVLLHWLIHSSCFPNASCYYTCGRDDDSLTSQSFTQSDDSLSALGYSVSSFRSTLRDCDLVDGESDLDHSETLSDSKFSDLTDLKQYRYQITKSKGSRGNSYTVLSNLMFVPVLMSSQVDLKNSSFLNYDVLKYSSNKRSSSYESPLQKKHSERSCHYPKVRPIPTISELVPTFAIVKAEMADFLHNYGFSASRICFCCHKKRLFFTWPYTCKICERVICPECCVEQCMHIPRGFFKTLVLTRDDDPSCQEQRTQLFCREMLQWDCSSVPLVFEPQDLSDNIPFHKLTMKNWTCMDICTKCEDFILDTVDRQLEFVFQSRQLHKKRSAQSATPPRRFTF